MDHIVYYAMDHAVIDYAKDHHQRAFYSLEIIAQTVV